MRSYKVCKGTSNMARRHITERQQKGKPACCSWLHEVHGQHPLRFLPTKPLIKFLDARLRAIASGSQAKSTTQTSPFWPSASFVDTEM